MPENTVSFEGLTLENFKERTGKRFRLTKAQKAANLTREQALQQWIASKQSAVTTS